MIVFMKPRILENTIRRAMKTFPAVMITGPRQSGKTTLLTKRFSDSHRYVSLENPDTRARALADPVGFFKENRAPLILDEIQYVPELLHYIKTAIDDDRKPGQWMLSGSQNFSLMEGVSQSLSGRVAVLSLLPFSIGESMDLGSRQNTIDEVLKSVFNGDSSKGDMLPGRSHVALDDWMLRGSYPEIRSNRDVDRQLWCASYIQTYLERDVRQIVNVGDLNSFERFLRICAGRTGQLLNMSEISRDVGVSVPTIKKWINILEASYQIYLLPPHHKNFGKRMTKSPKLYFLDPAIATFLMGLHSREPVLNGPMLGRLFESVVVSEWIKAFLHRGERPELFFWRSKGGLEIDMLIDRNLQLYPVEIKSTATLLPRHAVGLLKWKDLAGEFSANGLLVASLDRPTSVGSIRAIPWNLPLDDPELF